MEQKTYSVKFQRQRKFFVVLPLLVLPFTTLMFWALGGGQTGLVNENPLQGFNLKLPDAMLKDSEELNKLSYYEKAASDSLQLQKLRKSDPYFRSPQDGVLMENTFDGETSPGSTAGRNPYSKYANPNEEKVYRKLAELDKAMNQQANSSAQKIIETSPETQAEPADNQEMAKLEQMMLAMSHSPGPDPEMEQIDQVLEKVLDIQYPERVVERVRQNSEVNQGQVFPVSVDMARSPVSLLESTEPGVIPTKKFASGQASFHTINNQVDFNNQNAVNAVIHESQTLVSGSTVKLRLANNVYINGLPVPRNSFVYGIAKLTGERLIVEISSITHEGTLFPVDLSVFDMDGLEGIRVPGAIARDVAKQSASSSMQGINITTLDPSIGAQAASAGIEAAKSLFGKKVKQVKVTVKAGYKVLLFDQRQHRGT